MSILRKECNTLADEALMELLQKDKSEVAFEVIYNRYFNKLVYFSAKFVQSQTAAEDIVHDCFVKLLKQANSFDTHRTFSTWIYTIVKNESISQAARNNRQIQLAANLPNFSGNAVNAQGYDAAIIQQEMNKIFAELSDKEKLVYTLRIEQQLSIKEVAAIAELSEGSVKSNLFYTLKKIAKHLKVFSHE